MCQSQNIADRANLLLNWEMAGTCVALTNRPLIPDFRAGSIQILESHHRSDFVMEWRRDLFHKILVAVGGSGWVHFSDGNHRWAASALAVIPSGLNHRIVDDRQDPLSIYVICLGRLGFPGGSVLAKAFDEGRVIHDPALSAETVAALRRILFEQRTMADEAATLESALLAQLLVRIIRHQNLVPTGSSNAATRVRAYISELRESFWVRESMEDVAKRLGMSRRHFSGHFRKETGSTWLDFRHECRLNHADQLLRSTDLPIKAVSFECGYDDLSHFYRCFSSRFHTSPDAWRRR